VLWVNGKRPIVRHDWVARLQEEFRIGSDLDFGVVALFKIKGDTLADCANTAKTLYENAAFVFRPLKFHRKRPVASNAEKSFQPQPTEYTPIPAADLEYTE
jgi:hypothetical protein